MVRRRLWQQPGILLTLLVCLLIPLGLQAQEPPAEVNSLALILRGTGSAWGRFFVTSNDGAAGQAPRLVITYAEGQP